MSTVKYYSWVKLVYQLSKLGINIVAELFFEENRELIGTFESDKIFSVDSWDILGKILVQTSRTSGLSSVYSEILSFESCELYFHKAQTEGMKGKKFYDILYHFADGVPLGIRRADGTLIMRPDKDTIVEAVDDLLLLAEDDSTIIYSPSPIIEPRDLPYKYLQLESNPERELLLGWHHITSIIVREYADYLPDGSAIDIMIRNPGPEVIQEIDMLSENHANMVITIIDKDPMTLQGLASVRPYGYDNILILSQSGGNVSAEQMDSETLFILLLLLRKILRDREITDRTTKLITQVLNSENQELISQTNVDDFLISDRMISMIFSQLSEEAAMKQVYQEIFGESGSEIYLKPAYPYFTELPTEVTFADIMGAACKRDEICLGLRQSSYENDPKKNFGIVLNPRKDRKFTLMPDDHLVVLAEDEY